MAPTSLSSSNAIAGPSTYNQGHPRGRGTYVPQACSVCRYKKTKCDGKKPVCSACIASKRAKDCSWGKDPMPIRKNRNEAVFEALKKHNDALKDRVTYLETLLQRCQCQQENLPEGWLQRLDPPEYTDDMISFDDSPEPMGDHRELEVDGTEEAIQGLIAPIQKLTLVCGSLMTYGSTAVYRFRPVVVNKLPTRFPKVIEDPRETYILLVEGADMRCYNPSFEWNRYLPKGVPLTRQQHDRGLDLVFKFCLSWCLRIIPAFFLRDMCQVINAPPDQDPPPQTAHYSPMLHNVIVALALNLLDDPVLKASETKQLYIEEAKKYIDKECSQPNLSTVHALSTLGTYHSSNGDQTLGFMYFGMSARVSQALGLDVDCSEWIQSGLIEESDVLDRYWTFWTIFAQDVNWSLYVGRDFCVRGPTESDFKDMPVPFVDSEFDQMPFHHPPTNLPARPAYLSKTFAKACELFVVARRIMAVVNGISKTRIRASVIDEMISDIDLQLNMWKDSLPPEVDITPKTRNTATPHQLMLHIAYWWFFILLHRPYFHRKPRVIHSSDKDIDHVKLCKRGAENIVDLTKAWHDLYGLRYCPVNIVQPLFAAGTIYLLSGIQAASGTRVAHKELKHSFDSLKLCISHLKEISKSWGCASTVESILRGLIEERLWPAVEKRNKAVVPRVHGKSMSLEGGGDSGNASSSNTYLPNPPLSSRRQRSLKRSRVHQADAVAGVVTSPMHSPTISVHPAMDDFDYSARQRHQRSLSSQHPTSTSQELLSPWSTSPTQPIPIRGAGGANSNGSSSSGSPVSIRIAGSPGRYAASMVSSSPTTPEIQHASPSGSFIAGGSMPRSNGTNDNNTDPLLGLFSTFDGTTGASFGGSGGGGHEQQQHHQPDYSSMDMSRYFAMLGGQPLSAMPFVGPIPNGSNSDSAGGIFDQQQWPMHQQPHHNHHSQGTATGHPMDLSDLDFSSFVSGAPEHLTGEPSTTMTSAEFIMGGYYPPFGGGAGLSTNPADFTFPSSSTRRAVSENFRVARPRVGAQTELFSDFDFTTDYQ